MCAVIMSNLIHISLIVNAFRKFFREIFGEVSLGTAPHKEETYMQYLV